MSDCILILHCVLTKIFFSSSFLMVYPPQFNLFALKCIDLDNIFTGLLVPS